MMTTAIAAPTARVRRKRPSKIRIPEPQAEPAKKSSSDLLEMLIQDHQASVWRYIRALGCSSDLADDLTQETFLSVFRRPFEYLGPAAAASYLRRTAYHRYISHLKSQKLNQTDLDAVATAHIEWNQWKEEQRTDSEILDAMKECLSDLPPRSRKALEMRYRDGKSRQEIAAALGLSENGTKNLMQRAKKRLRQSIECRMIQQTRSQKGVRSLTL